MTNTIMTFIKHSLACTMFCVILNALPGGAVANAQDRDDGPQPDALSLQILALLELEQKDRIFAGLIELKDSANKTHRDLQESDAYQPELFYTAVLLKRALSHLPKTNSDMPSCDELRSAMEFDYGEVIEAQEMPIPYLWLLLNKVCKPQAENN